MHARPPVAPLPAPERRPRAGGETGPVTCVRRRRRRAERAGADRAAQQRHWTCAPTRRPAGDDAGQREVLREQLGAGSQTASFLPGLGLAAARRPPSTAPQTSARGRPTATRDGRRSPASASGEPWQVAHDPHSSRQSEIAADSETDGIAPGAVVGYGEDRRLALDLLRSAASALASWQRTSMPGATAGARHGGQNLLSR